ncbi:shikimate dehydrogenase [Rhodanobacter thiooxydans]|uniref:Shikimate dehydrogenase (NADP(+)) n=1 Tax=Rhodanobacter thiooxydans TaxID=416169 RepID=A0A154QHW4_9GAMM|nr:shikimate dehydrogenase [Rhodanobacter thiooxydans]EIL97084.1 shikimate 5-dehydrogenase [Rhodanobacter thiooxydans LCS2]KZC23729.1 shikimate dehydrogenase [Rhodanobacter thiooxydans]MCW0202973.1 shikimate dehydrogenase [Rhodanobacter thiooxydans]
MPVAQFAVFGHPISHSLSPTIHQAFARQFGIELEYRAVDVGPADFAAVVHRFFADGGRGANVTLPHKAAAFALAAQRSVTATRAGSANVLTPLAAGRLAAHNTDGDGLVRDLTERHDLDLRGHTALLLGAGGAAHGVAWNLLDAGVETLTIVNRSPAAADALADAIGDPARAHTRYWGDLADIGSYDLIVNATSAGVLGVALQLPPSLVGARALCYDLSYGPAASSFLSWAKTAGALYAVDGLGMLVETAADAFELWHGQRPDTESVYQSLRQQGTLAHSPERL